MGGARVEQNIVAEYVKQLEPVEVPVPEETAEPEGELADAENSDAEEVVVVFTNPAVELSGTSLHNALLEFDIPALEPFENIEDYQLKITKRYMK